MMSAEDRQVLIALFREFVNLMEENGCMALILDKAEIADLRVADWREEVKRLRQLPIPTCTLADSMRVLIDDFERSPDENDWTSLIGQMQHKKPN